MCEELYILSPIYVFLVYLSNINVDVFFSYDELLPFRTFFFVLNLVNGCSFLLHGCAAIGGELSSVYR